MPARNARSRLALRFGAAALAALPLLPAADRALGPREAEATVELAAVAALQSRLASVVGEQERGRWSVLAVSLDRGDTLYALNPHQRLAPASNMKLFTTAAALAYLGPDYRFKTYLMADGPVQGGVLDGNLYLYGTGDPTLGRRFSEAPAPEIRALADSLVAMGVREVRGAVVGDGSFFAGSGSGEGWQPSYMNSWYAAPAGALSVHENLVRVVVEPGVPGGPAQLRFVPGGEGISVINEAMTGGGRAQVTRTDYHGPVLVRGGSGGGTNSQAVPVADAATYAAAVLREVLLEKGIVVHGGLRSTDQGAVSPLTGRQLFAPALENGGPRLRVLATQTSGPLHEILEVINHQSHNFYSEQVFRAAGRAFAGEGSAASGARAVESLLAQAGVDTTAVRVVDGCGLSPLNHVSATDFVALLGYMNRSPQAEAFLAPLPVAGEVRRFRRMGGTAAAGNLRAKTGTINHVSALSGFVTSRNGERIAFSIIANDLGSTSRAKHLENLIGVQLASFDRGTAAGPMDLPVSAENEEEQEGAVGDGG